MTATLDSIAQQLQSGQIDKAEEALAFHLIILGRTRVPVCVIWMS